MQTHVSLKIDNEIAYLTFACEQPGKPTTLDHTVLDELGAALEDVYTQADKLRALVVQSESEKYFVVGANINALQTLDPGTIVSWVRHGHEVFNRLENLPIPVIAKIKGFALGGGLELALACDLIVASNNAKLGQPEARLGFVAGWGGSYRLPKRVGIARAKELFFTGKVIDAETAANIGLVDFVGNDSDVEAYLQTLLQDIAECSPTAVAWMKKLIESSTQTSIEENCLGEAVASSECLATQDTQTRVSTYLAERKKKATK